jgi:hypothetical protein
MNVKLTRHLGRLKVDINGKLYEPLSFKSFRPNPKNVSEFYKAGVRLFSVLSSGIINALGVPYSRFGESWVGDGKYDFSTVDAQMDMFIENAPDGYFAPMFQIDTRPWYLEAHEGTPNSFKHLSWAAYDDEWKKAAAEYLKAVIRHCEEKYGDRIYGYFILGGTTTEWLAHPDKEASHPLKEAAYKRYSTNPSATLPSMEELESVGSVFLDESENNVYTSRRFHADTVADLILYFAGEAQSVIKHKKLLGLYYGYLLHLGGSFLFNSGHLAYERVFLSPDIDMISSPSDYSYRGIFDPSAFMVTQKTLDAHEKLYFLEFDHITHVAPTMINEPSADPSCNTLLREIPGAKSKCKDETETLNLMWRDYILCYANGAAMWWFDMFDGWFRSESMMGTIERMIALHGTLANKDKSSIAEIAIYAEGESMYHVRKTSNLASVGLCNMQRTFAELGAPYDFYSISDIDNCDSTQYKLIILLDQYDIPIERMKKIHSLQSEGICVLWMYAPDYANNTENNASRISEAVGLTVFASNESHGNVIYNGRTIENTMAAPYFSITDQDAQIYARYEDGTAAVAGTIDGKSVYSAVPFISSDIIRDTARKCGIFLYSDTPLVYTYVNACAIGVYNATEGNAYIHVRKNGTYRDMVEGGIYESKNGTLILPKKSLRAYLLVKEN